MEEPLTKISVWERMTRFNERSVLGRVVINPPGRMAPLTPHPTGEEWFFCKPCGFACQTRETMLAHKEKHLQKVKQETSEEEEEDDGETQVIGNGNESDEDVALEFTDDIINKKRDHFQCGVCRKILVSLKGLRNHHLVHQNQRPEKCKLCGATFKKKMYCVRHIKKSHDPSFQNCCKFCPCRFETERGLQSHLMFYHDTSLIGNKIEPVAPIKLEGTADIPLEQSKKSYGIKRAAAPRKYKSSIKIKLSFSSKYLVQNRTDRSIVLKAIHHNSKSFECHICRRTCSSGVSLRNHMLIHTGEKPLTCNKCGASFRSRSALVKHVKRNHGDGAFSCHFCPCKLAAEWVRRLHCYRYHPDEVNPDTKFIDEAPSWIPTRAEGLTNEIKADF